ATTAMTTISENPMSNMQRKLGRLLLLRFALDRVPRDLLRLVRRRGLLGLRRLHAFLEALHRAAQILPDVAQLLGAEDQHDDQKYDQPVPDAQSTHDSPPLSARLGHHPAQRLGTAENVHVQMHHFLPSDASRVDDRAIAVGQALLAREPPDRRE